MTTRAAEVVTCANCGAESEQAVVMSTNEFGSPDLDLRPPEGRRSTIDTLLQLCPGCGRVAYELEEADPAVLPGVLASEAYRAALVSAEHPKLSRRFLAFAVAMEAAGDIRAAGQALLHAAWVCDDAGVEEAAAGCRRQAAEAWSRFGGGADDSACATVAAQRVDALRRAGDHEEAAAACEAALGMPGAKSFLGEVLRFQKRLIEEGDAGRHTVAEVGEDG